MCESVSEYCKASDAGKGADERLVYVKDIGSQTLTREKTEIDTEILESRKKDKKRKKKNKKEKKKKNKKKKKGNRKIF